MKRRQEAKIVKQNIDNKKKLLITKFEDLSNELIYEIFDYFDYFFIYEIFSKLNIRFQSLFINSSLLLKINLSLISKSIFQNHYKSMINTNIKRIISLNITKYFLDYFSINLFSSLQSLIIYEIHSDKICLLINHLDCLPNFSSLSIYSSDYFQNENSIYLSIFHLSKLKFCKLTFPSGGQRIPLPLATNQCQTLKRLILNGHVSLDQLISILSYLPKLDHLSCEYLYGSECTEIDIVSIPVNLISICLTLYCISFNELKLFLLKISFQLKKLRIKKFNDENFLNVKQWEELILNYMPCLCIFDLQYIGLIDDNFRQNLIEQFYSKFWIERKWLFDYYYYKNENSYYLNFFSTVPYRYNHFILYEQINNDICKSYQNNSINFARHLTIEGHLKTDKYSIQFPRVTKLTLKNNSIEKNSLFFNDINSIIPLIQIIDLDIKDNHFSIIELTKILSLLPNLQSLTLSNILSFQFKRIETTKLISQNNKITKLIIDDDECQMKHIHCLIHLFPHLQYLEIGIDENNLEEILRYLLLKSKSLFALFLLNLNYKIIEKIQGLIKNENLIHDYTIERIHGGLYLWW
ncbi:unnamed protein product [Rotaria sordida]|uniref:F-box domain-containing protein n=1 Tax=Rotaria sordida TaxID=392033 RepID=A0A814IAT5_9BILA|nr:unnamed protein product [Rotaria sordida]CAF1019280.1 unnamed protein product [Rotaria sordida]